MKSKAAACCLGLLLSFTALAGEAAVDPAAALVTYGSSAEGGLHGFIYKPEGKGPFPAVLWNHGSEKAPGWQAALGHFYTSKGYVFFIPHRHGHGRSAGEYIADLQKGLHGAELIALHERYNKDVETAVSWLARQSFVDPKRMVMSGLSYGGIQTLLAAEKGLGMRAFVPFAPGAMSWAHAPELGVRLTEAVRRARGPIFLLQSANDFSLSPTEVLGAELKRKGLPDKSKLYPAFGTSHEDGHGGFATKAEGIALWGPEVLEFMSQSLK